jgi:sugar/nucleoside kinase (ribokinase family)
MVLERIGSGLGGGAAAKLEASDRADPCSDEHVPGATAATTVQSTDALHAASAPASRPKDGDIRIWEVPADSVATVDSTGGGDAFCGALAAALAEGRSLAEAARRAVAAGALATTHVGAREGMPTLAELDEFLADRPAV